MGDIVAVTNSQYLRLKGRHEQFHPACIYGLKIDVNAALSKDIANTDVTNNIIRCLLYPLFTADILTYSRLSTDIMIDI